MAADVTNLEELPARVDSIEQKLDALTTSVDRRFEEVNRRFDEVDKRFDDVDRRFEEVSEHFVEQREHSEFAFGKVREEMLEGFGELRGRIATNTAGLARLERRLERFEGKFDEFVESQRIPRRRQRPGRAPKKRSKKP